MPDVSHFAADFNRYRIGLIVVDNDPVPEIEIQHLAPRGVSVHTARFHLPRSLGSEFIGDPPTELVGPHLTEALTTLERIGVDAVGLCFTSSSIFNPSRFDLAFEDAAMSINPSWVVWTAAEALMSSMFKAGVSNPYVLVPPWFTEPTVAALHRYLADRGIGIEDAKYYDLDPSWNHIPRQDRFDHGAKWHINPRDVAKTLGERNLGGADSILIPGSGFPSIDVLNREPVKLGLPVFSANSAVLGALLLSKPMTLLSSSPAWIRSAND